MFKRRTANSTSLVSLVVGTLLLIVTFALIGFVALSVILGNNPARENSTILGDPTAGPATAVQAAPPGTPNPLALRTFKSPALGFSVEYPRVWRKNEKGLQVIFSPSEAGLDPDNLQAAAIRFGIPADNTIDPNVLLTQIQASLLQYDWTNLPTSEPVTLRSIIIDDQTWLSTQLSFEDEQLGGPAIARIATTHRDQVGYFVVAIAPAEKWRSFEPKFQNILNSFHFTSEAVLRPTDATPPPTPTATPTPVIYIVRSGDTLLHIALQYGVDVEVLADRNGIDDPRSLQTGTKLIIPIKRR